jgi:hypothetical protein
MNIAFETKSYKTIIPSLCFSLNYFFNLIVDYCAKSKDAYLICLNYLIQTMLKTEKDQIKVEIVKLNGNKYKILNNTESISLFPQLNRYFGLMCSLIDHHSINFKQLIGDYDLKLYKKPNNESYFGKFEDKMLYITEPCFKSTSLYFKNLLTHSENQIEIDYVK